MAKLFGAIGWNDSERVFNQTRGQQVVWTETQKIIDRYNAEMQNVMNIFVDGTTESFKERFKLPGFGTLQQEGSQARSASVKSGGAWDVAYPLRQYSDAIEWDDVTMAYMTVKEYDNHVQTVLNDDSATMRIIMLNALFNNAAVTFNDVIHGALTIQPLANGDSTLFPPPLGTSDEATQNGYFASGYAASGISDTNNPFATIANYLEGLFGTPTAGSNIWTFINNAQTAKVKALVDFVPVTDYAVKPGIETATLVGMPAVPPNMRLLGRLTNSGCWVFEWRRIPANYIVGIHGEQQKPLVGRVDPKDVGLPGGLNLISKEMAYPMSRHNYRRRIGFGVGNRLNGAIMFLDASNPYTVPTITA